LIFGFRYPKETDTERGQIKVDMFDIFNYVSATSTYSITYFHTTLGKFNKGPLSSFRKLYGNLDTDRQSRLITLNLV